LQLGSQYRVVQDRNILPLEGQRQRLDDDCFGRVARVMNGRTGSPERDSASIIGSPMLLLSAITASGFQTSHNACRRARCTV
jgi:hypothetical protein